MQIKTERSFTSNHYSLYQGIFGLTQSLKHTYPNYEKWYYQTFLKGLKKGERSIIFASDKEQIIGCALIKNTPMEKKLCTLFVDPIYRKRGIGEQLLQASIQELGQNPLVSVSGKNRIFVKSLFSKFNFHLSAIKKAAYKADETEYYFNDARADIVQNKLIPALILRRKQLEKN